MPRPYYFFNNLPAVREPRTVSAGKSECLLPQVPQWLTTTIPILATPLSLGRRRVVLKVFPRRRNFR